MTISMMTMNTTQLDFSVGSPLFYIVIGAGGVMTVLLLIILVLCVAIGCLASRKRRTYAFPQANQPQQPAQVALEQGEDRQATAQNTQQLQSNVDAVPVNGSQPQGGYSEVNTYDIVGVGNEEDHTYAMVNEAQLQRQPRHMNTLPSVTSHTHPQSQQVFGRSEEPSNILSCTAQRTATLRRTRSYNDIDGLILTRGMSMIDKVNKQRSSSWCPLPQELSKKEPQTSSGKAKKKISRVYDAVGVPVAKATDGAAAGGMQYNKLLHPGYPKRQAPSPRVNDPVLAAMYSKLDVDRNKSHTASDKQQSTVPHGNTAVQEKRMNQKERKPHEMAKQAPQEMKHGFEEAPLYSNVGIELVLHKNLSRSGPIYSVPDMDKKKRERRQKSHEQLDRMPADPFEQMLEMSDLALPLYSNINEELGHMAPRPSGKPATGPVYSIPDMDKKRGKRSLRKQQSDNELMKGTDQKQQQVRPLPPEPMEASSSPLYSNLQDERDFVQSMPGAAHHMSDLEPKLKRNRPHQASQRTDRASQRGHQDATMEELAPRHKTFSSSPLYSNMNAEMHPVREIQSRKGHQPPPVTPGAVYSIPDMKKKRQGRQAKKDQQLTRQRKISSPSPPPLPSPTITESMKMDFDLDEPRYPHVSVPTHLRTIKPMPNETAAAMPAYPEGHYDTPRRNDLYKPLPLMLKEDLYDVPRGKTTQVFASVEELGCHYDMPSSLSYVPSTKGHGRSPMQGHESMPGKSREEELGQRGRRKK